MSDRPPKPRERDAFWVQCFTAALAGSARDGGEAELFVEAAYEIADAAVGRVRDEQPMRDDGHGASRPIPDRSRHAPQHVGVVKVHKG